MTASAAAPAAGSDPALRFWLAYAASEGALVEQRYDDALVLLPPTLQTSLDLPEELTVTSDPAAAREDGSLLVAAGHPLTQQAAEDVLDRGDVGIRHLAWPARTPPTAEVLQARARDWLPVDHGRVDLTEDPSPVYLPVLRIGVLVHHAVSLDHRFQERDEAWLDATSGLVLGDPTAAVLAANPQAAAAVGVAELVADVASAAAAADAALTARAAARLGGLVAESAGARADELAQAATYYAAQLDSIQRRRTMADPDRQRVLDAQAEATTVERERRLAEIDEKFRARHELRPFRAHLVLVPALSLDVIVRRGPRCYPLPLTWMLPAATFAPVRCPHCASRADLVAGRRHLGCRRCLP
jgi:hypothetical protein